MIASQRRAHFRIQVLLWPLLFALLAGGLSVRRAEPALSTTPAWLTQLGPSRAAPVLWSREDLFGAWPARITARADATIEVAPLRPIDRPELLLYWDAAPPVANGLPLEARLLGRVAGTSAQAFPLPESARADPHAGGNLILYSLGHQAIVATAVLPALGPVPGAHATMPPHAPNDARHRDLPDPVWGTP